MNYKKFILAFEIFFVEDLERQKSVSTSTPDRTGCGAITASPVGSKT